eukprot:TRINITY_DN26239_c0_g4_i1.p1 TRINITY_DN26239_c0_g4~~TRINITY_DN26239_c0_g4_i1.p1  ORF type:complete len:351 (+),score=92.34 TRINITY_DN26239_c0_g4_i1:97-1149(+)
MSLIYSFFFIFFFLMIRRPPRSTLSSSSAASDVYKRQVGSRIESRTAPVTGIDIGTGASCIYPLLGARVAGWRFIATEVDPVSVASAQANVSRSKLESQICVEQLRATEFLMAVVAKHGNVDFCMCNPPFFETMKEAAAHPGTTCMGTASECVARGGEVGFVTSIISDSAQLRDRVSWYSTMLGKKTSLEPLMALVRQAGATLVRTTEFSQGHQARWGLAWSFVAATTMASVVSDQQPALKSRNNSREFGVASMADTEVRARVELVLKESGAVVTTSAMRWEGVVGSDVDGFRFTVHAYPGQEGWTVEATFVAGKDEARKAFWKFFEKLECDVQRTNRRWRRMMAKQAGA